MITYVVASAAPPARKLHELLALLDRDPEHLVVVTTPTAFEWIDETLVRPFTAWPVRSSQRRADEPKIHPAPDLLIAAPLTFNTINKWAAGINDNVALGVLNEALGEGLPIVASAVVKTTMARHPAFVRNIETLTGVGVSLTATNALLAAPSAYEWRTVVDLANGATPHRNTPPEV